MGTRPRKRPIDLAGKLFMVRQYLGLSQQEMAACLGSNLSYRRISEFESGAREPNLLVLLAYSQLASIHVEYIINDKISLSAFRDVLCPVLVPPASIPEP
jgi:transcriptional regulator with XRE-family HTH domain